ncbi:unnamed protein product [Ascophyllum nodosum]
MSSAQAVFRAFKLQGLGIRADAARAIVRVASGEDDPDDAVQAIIRATKARIERNELGSNVVDVDTVTAVVAELTSGEQDLADSSTQIQSAFYRPRLYFDPVRNTLLLEDSGTRKRRTHGPSESKARMYRERYLMVRQRVQRHELFRPPIIESSRRDYIKLSPLDSLVGSSDLRWLLGMLIQAEEGKYFLEDLMTRIPIDLSKAHKTEGLFTEHCVVIVEGRMTDGVFEAITARVQVAMVGFPPIETREDSLRALGRADLFGTGVNPQQMERMRQLEIKASDAMFVIVSDVHLDKPQVMEKLEVLFDGFQHVQPPPHFVLMGNFCSSPVTHAPDSVAQAVARFDALCKLILKFPGLASSAKFVFLPGPEDPGAGDTLPRPPLPTYFTRSLRENLGHASFASNPCRLRFFTQEMVFFRDDILKKMQRHILFPPSDPDMDVTEHCTKTLLHQGHLCPLPLAARPIHWELDDALWLYPLPHVVVLADRTDQYRWLLGDCCALNPGSFPADASFVVYRPASRTVEFSRVD